MLISEVIDGVKAYCGHDWGGPIMDDTTRDQVRSGVRSTLSARAS